MSLKLPPPLHVDTVLGALDDAARASAREAGDLTLAAVRRFLPARTGRTRAGQRRAVRRTGTGYTIEIAPSSRVRYPNGVSAKQVTRWVDQGTGIFGPRHTPIRPRRGGAFHLPSGWVSGELPGQRAVHAYEQAQSTTEALVQRELAAGAARGAKLAEAALARSLGR